MSTDASRELQQLYENRFGPDLDYRRAVWRVLIDDYFQREISAESTVLDLGCGYGEFINQIRCAKKLAMDLNPDAPKLLTREVEILLQDCAAEWPLPDASVDVVFTSNFFEHLPDKRALSRTLDHVRQALKPGGRLIALGPNIRYLPGAYWDFWDHHVPLTEQSLCEALRSRGFTIERCLPRFLPYTMARGRKYPLWCLRLYLKLTPLWSLLGRQFLVIATRPT
jgi:SAM-dependent methyltransferase